MSSRRFTLFISVFLIAAILVGCAPATPAAPAATSAPAATVAATATDTSAPAAPTAAPAATTAPASGKKILNGSVLINAMTPNFNPFISNPVWPTVKGVFEPLMVYNTIKAELVPWLADSYTWSADFKTLTFKLHPGVKWSDGQPFTSKDVVYTFDLLKNTKGVQGPALSALNGPVASYAAQDDSTVVFTMKTANTMALYDIANQDIVPEHIWKSVADPTKFTNDKPVGTGPFTEVVDFQPQTYEIDKNPNYWQPGKPAFDGIRVTAYSGNDAENAALIAGQIDWTGTVLPTIEQAVIAHNPKIAYHFPPSSMTVLMHLNPAVKPFDDPIVRKAMSMALNRDQMTQVAFNSLAKGSDVTGLSDAYKVWKVEDPSTLGDWTIYNPEKAGKMLEDAGYKLGADGVRTMKDGKTPMKFKLTMVQGFTDWISAGEIMVQNWKDIGVTVDEDMIDPGAFFGAIPTGHFDIALWFGYSSPTPYGQYLNMMGSATVAPAGQFSMVNFARYGSKNADALLEQFAATNDQTKQIEIAKQLEKVFADEAPVVPLWAALDYGIFNTATFTGWPSKENPYSLAFPQGAVDPEQLIVMMNIQPVK